MVVKDLEIKNAIVSYLRQTETGASASEIAKKIGFNRVTVGKYLQVLAAEKLVSSKRVASAIYWTLTAYSEKPRVLIVDDEQNIVDLIRLSLANGRYDIYEANNGREALEVVKNIMPNLIILDLMMPGVSGDEVCRELKSNFLTQSIPVIIVSAKGEAKDKVQLMSLGADDYITKPFDPMELEARVANKLKKKDLMFSKNSVTNFPSEIVTTETVNLWKHKKKYFKLVLKLNNFDGFIDLFGHKKGFEILQFFSRLLVELFPEEVFIGHRSDSEFILLSEKNVVSIVEELKLRFVKMVPYFYEGLMESFSKYESEIKINKEGEEVIHKVLSLEVDVDD